MSNTEPPEPPLRFFAHSTERADGHDWQLLSEHAIAVGDEAGEFASAFGARVLGLASGLLHDLGKYTLPFQARLHGSLLRVDHSTHGARIAQQRFGPVGQLLAYGIAGHHAGLANGQGEGERTPLAERLAAELPTLEATWEKEIRLPDKLVMPPGFKPYSENRQQARERLPFQLAFLTRMLFSCLVDADFLDTERFYNRAERRPDHRRAGNLPPSLPELREQLDIYLKQFSANSDVNRLRADILRHARAQAEREPGLFSLTVPTGGGKTLASLAFALDHAIAHGLRRVIFVIPFTSIVEQNATVFRKALGPLGEAAVLEHHSAFVQADPPRDDPER